MAPATLIAHNGADASFAALALTGLLTAGAGVKIPTVVASGDGAIAISPGAVGITKGSIAALTLAAPTAVTHDGYILNIYTETAFAHVITGGVDGFNAKGSSGTLTFTAAKGNSVTLVARNGHWWVLALNGVTVA